MNSYFTHFLLVGKRYALPEKGDYDIYKATVKLSGYFKNLKLKVMSIYIIAIAGKKKRKKGEIRCSLREFNFYT